MIKAKDYIPKLCYGNFIGSCNFAWIFYFPGECRVSREHIKDGNVTKTLRSYVNKLVENTKAVHMTSALLDASFHNAGCEWCLMPGYKAVKVPAHIAYIAHLRMNEKPPDKCNSSVH